MKPTLKKLIANTAIPETLVRAVVRQLGGWNAFTEAAPDIASHGISAGFRGFIYYKDTHAFAKRHLPAIQALAAQQAKDCGMSALTMIRGFGCFRGNKPTNSEIGMALYAGKDDDDSGVLNALAWYAGEEVAQAFQDLTENDQ